MSAFETVMSMSAASSASEAAAEARKASANSAERLEGAVANPFITFEMLELEEESQGFFTSSKYKLGGKLSTVSIKRTDIGFLKQKTDSYGTSFVRIFLEDRCNLGEEYINVAGDLATVQAYVNNAK